MAEREFRILRPTGYSGPQRLSTITAIVAARTIKGKGPFQRRKNHEPVATNGAGRAVTGFRKALVRGDVGDVFSLRDGKGHELIRVRETKSAVHVIETNGNKKADVYWTYAKEEFPGASWAGAYVCKYILGTHEHSQHSYGNAVDVFVDNLDALADWAVSRAEGFSLEHVIVKNRVWTRGSGWSAYGGEYHYHVHVDFCKNLDPALPCGVREGASCGS